MSHYDFYAKIVFEDFWGIPGFFKYFVNISGNCEDCRFENGENTQTDRWINVESPS
jgi:hypothetical protein